MLVATVIICVLGSVVSGSPLQNSQNDVISLFNIQPASQVPLDEQWMAFKMKHGKTYESEHEDYRKKVFRDNLKVIEEHNTRHRQGLVSFRLGVNHLADMTNEEFRQTMNGFKPRANLSALNTNDRLSYLSPILDLQLPKSIDYRTKGYVTPVKNQGACGSCWSFSATGSLEGQHFRKTGRLISLSEQNLVDCSTAWGNNGCNGGLMDNAFQYVKDNGGIDTENTYPYDAADETCHFTRGDVGATDMGYTDIPSGNENKLKEALATVGPISIAIDAGHRSFQMYDSGVYVEPACSPSQLDHGVLIVGYGTDETGQDFWIVKNSWGEQWGESGYIRMARNMENQCGVASQASYPNV